MQEQIEAVQRMQEYIEKHLCENISFADAAKASLFSPWHARRLFLEYTGVTPSEYIRKLRLKQSALKLRDEDINILDVALDSGFGSVDGYQRAFCKEFGCNPSAYAADPIPLRLFTPLRREISLYEKEGNDHGCTKCVYSGNRQAEKKGYYQTGKNSHGVYEVL